MYADRYTGGQKRGPPRGVRGLEWKITGEAELLLGFFFEPPDLIMVQVDPQEVEIKTKLYRKACQNLGGGENLPRFDHVYVITRQTH